MNIAHAMYASARREDFLAEARQARLVAQLGAEGDGWAAIRRQVGCATWKAIKAAALLMGGASEKGLAPRGATLGRQGIR